MDDKFLHDLRREPRPEFAEELRRKLERQGPAGTAWRRAWARLRFAPALGFAAATAVVLLFAFPSVRAGAQAFLDLFRVKNFAAVTVDPARIERLKSGGVDIQGLLAEQVVTLKEPGPPRVFSDVEAAGAAAGIPVMLPAAPPGGLEPDSIVVTGEGEARLTANVSRLREVMAALGIDDLSVPEAWDGAEVNVRMPAVVAVRYRSDRARVALLQARSPEVSLPPGLDLARVGEIGLRIAGLSPAEARRFAGSIDWHSTLLVPVPANVSSFREVHVRGSKGLLVTTTREGGGRRRGSTLMWSEGDMVYALAGDLDRVSLVEMAGSLQVPAPSGQVTPTRRSTLGEVKTRYR